MKPSTFRAYWRMSTVSQLRSVLGLIDNSVEKTTTKNMTWRPRNVFECLIPLLTTFAIIGHGVFYYPPGRRHPRFSLIYAVTVSSLFYLVMAFTVKFYYDSPWYDLDARMFFNIVYANVAIGILAQILSWYYMERLFDIIQRIGKIDETLHELGATFDYTESLKLGIKMIILWILVTIILNLSEVLWLVAYVPLEVISLTIGILHLPIHINSMVSYNFSYVVSLLGMRFRKANELLEKIVKPVRLPVNDRGWKYLGRKISVIPFTISPRPIFRGAMYKKNLIYIIKQVHLELSAISNIINRAYGVQVALEIAACFIVTTCFLYDIYRTAIVPSMRIRYMRIMAQVIWCTTYFTKVVVINRVAEAISAEAHRTGDILHRMENPIGDSELPDEIQQFSFQIKQNRLFFSPAGLVTLGWKFLRGFIATVTTYLVIFIQNDQ